MKKLLLSSVFLVFLPAVAKAQPTAIVALTGAGATEWWSAMTKADGPMDSPLGKTILLAEGAPKAEPSASFAGLPAKREVVVLGVCDLVVAKAWVKVFAALGAKGIEARPAKSQDPGCPVLDDARLKRITVLQKPLLDKGMLTFVEAKGLLGDGAGKKQAMALIRREATLFDAWAPPPAPTDADCVSFVDRRLGLVQVDCTTVPEGNNCFVTDRVGYTVAAVGMGLKAKASKPREIKRECGE